MKTTSSISNTFHPNQASTSLSTGLGSTSTLITDMFGDPYQFFLNLPFGEIEERDSPTLKNNKKSCRQSMAEQRRSGSFNNPYKFNGKELDSETGLYYYGARYYNPRISTFISVDPLAEHTMTPYQYTYQNPVKYIDPTGMAAEDPPNLYLIEKYRGTILEYHHSNSNSIEIIGKKSSYFAKPYLYKNDSVFRYNCLSIPKEIREIIAIDEWKENELGFWNVHFDRNFKIQIFAGIDNVLNEKFSLGNDINAFGNRYFNPAPERNYYAGLKFEL